MKHLSKWFTALAALCAVSTVAWATPAKWVWNGGTGSEAAPGEWSTTGNWTWVTADGQAASTSLTVGYPSDKSQNGDNAWLPIEITDAYVSTSSAIEGWNFQLTLSDAHVTLSKFTKMQGATSLDLSGNSTLTVTRKTEPETETSNNLTIGTATIEDGSAFIITSPITSGSWQEASNFTLDLGEINPEGTVIPFVFDSWQVAKTATVNFELPLNTATKVKRVVRSRTIAQWTSTTTDLVPTLTMTSGTVTVPEGMTATHNENLTGTSDPTSFAVGTYNIVKGTATDKTYTLYYIDGVDPGTDDLLVHLTVENGAYVNKGTLTTATVTDSDNKLSSTTTATNTLNETVAAMNKAAGTPASVPLNIPLKNTTVVFWASRVTSGTEWRNFFGIDYKLNNGDTTARNQVWETHGGSREKVSVYAGTGDTMTGSAPFAGPTEVDLGTDTKLHHWVVVTDDTKQSFYMDGVPIGLADGYTLSGIHDDSIIETLGLGGSVTRAGKADACTLGDVYVYQKAMTASEVQSHYYGVEVTEAKTFTATIDALVTDFDAIVWDNSVTGTPSLVDTVVLKVKGDVELELETEIRATSLTIEKAADAESASLKLTGSGKLSPLATHISISTDASELTADLGSLTIAEGATLVAGANVAFERVASTGTLKLTANRTIWLGSGDGTFYGEVVIANGVTVWMHNGNGNKKYVVSGEEGCNPLTTVLKISQSASAGCAVNGTDFSNLTVYVVEKTPNDVAADHEFWVCASAFDETVHFMTDVQIKTEQEDGGYTFASLAGTGGISWATGSSPTITIAKGAEGRSYSGNFEGTNEWLKKEGSGTQTLSGASTYAAGTTINGGTLRLTEGGVPGSGAVTVNADGTFEHAGTTTISNNVTVNGTLSGTGTISGTVTFNAGAILDASAGALTVTGAVSLPSEGKVSVTCPTSVTEKTALLKATGLSLDKFTSTTVPADWKLAVETDGLYLVAKDYVALVGTTKYEDLQEAINALNGANGTVTLLKSGVTLPSPLPTNVTFVKGANVEITAPDGYKWVDGTLVACNYVAQVTVGAVTSKYESLADAISNAADGATVTLLDNIVMEAKDGTSGAVTPIVEIAKNLTLDLNGHTISLAEKDSVEGIPGVIYISDGANVTIAGEGKIDAECGNNGAYGVHVFNGSVTIKKATVTGAPTAVSVVTGSANIEGGHYELAETCAAANTSTTYLINCVDVNYANDDAGVTITGGSFKNWNPSDNSAEGDYTNFATDGNIGTVDDKGNYTLKEGSYVARVDGKQYETLQAAVDAATDGATVTVIADYVVPVIQGTANHRTPLISITKDITLDLNGKTLSVQQVESITGTPVILYVSGATVTVKGNGTVDGNCGNNAVFAANVDNGGTLTIKNGTFIGGVSAIQVTEGNLIIEDGTFDLVDACKSIGGAYLINCIDGSESTVSISGGKYYDFNPADNDAENPAENFCATGYTAVANGKYYEVIEKPNLPAVEDPDNPTASDTLSEASQLKIVAAVDDPTTITDVVGETKGEGLSADEIDAVLELIAGDNLITEEDGVVTIGYNFGITDIKPTANGTQVIVTVKAQASDESDLTMLVAPKLVDETEGSTWEKTTEAAAGASVYTFTLDISELKGKVLKAVLQK